MTKLFSGLARSSRSCCPCLAEDFAPFASTTAAASPPWHPGSVKLRGPKLRHERVPSSLLWPAPGQPAAVAFCLSGRLKGSAWLGAKHLAFCQYSQIFKASVHLLQALEPQGLCLRQACKGKPQTPFYTPSRRLKIGLPFAGNPPASLCWSRASRQRAPLSTARPAATLDHMFERALYVLWRSHWRPAQRDFALR